MIAIIIAIGLVSAEAATVVAAVTRVIGTLNSLSTAGLAGVLRSLLVGKMVSAVARELGFGENGTDFELGGILLTDDGRTAAAQAAAQAAPLFAKAGFALDVNALLTDVDRFVSALGRGRAVAGGPGEVGNGTWAGRSARLGTGEFEHEAIDLEIDGAGANLRLVRTYRSRTVYLGPLGPSWDHSYNCWLRQEGEHVVVRLTGRLTEQRFVRHPRFDEPDYAYFAPPDGVHDILVADGAGSFQIRTPGGDVLYFEPTDQPGEHRLRRQETRFGSGLDLRYDEDGRLSLILVNSQFRFVRFVYDVTGRLDSITDHTGRTVTYAYDDGHLTAVRGPEAGHEQSTPVETYEYSRVGARKQLSTIRDWAGRVIIENEYETGVASEFSGWLTRQTAGRSEYSFTYEPIAELPVEQGAARDTAVLHVTDSRADGRTIHHWLNGFGCALISREDYIDQCRVRRAITRTWYNADGAVIARVDPEGSVTQYLYARDQVAAQVEFPDIDPVIGDLPYRIRASFGNLLASVARGRRIGADDPVPPIKRRDHPDDIVHKYTYLPELCLLRTASDPRTTESADPLHVESAPAGSPAHDPADARYLAHQRHLTRRVYDPAQSFALIEVQFPDRSRPSALDGVPVLSGPIERFSSFAPNGIPLRHTDANGHVFLNEFAPPSAGAKEGYLRARWLPQLDLPITTDTPELLEITRTGDWGGDSMSLTSSGAVGDSFVLEFTGDRLEIWQTTVGSELRAAHPNVRVTVDGVALAGWDQSIEAEYVAAGLGTGIHRLELDDASGTMFSVGRIRTHVKLEFLVDDLGRVVREIDGRGIETHRAWDAVGREVRTELADSVTTRVHDPKGRVLRERKQWHDPGGAPRPEQAVVRTRCFDTSGNLISDSEGPEAAGAPRRTRYQYDDAGRLSEINAASGTRTAYRYDAMGRQVRRIRAACTPICQTETTEYDRAGNIVAERNGRGAQWRTEVDAHGRTVLRVDPLGHLSSIDYSRRGPATVERLFQRRGDGSYELLSRRSTQLDEHGDVISTRDALFQEPILVADPFTAPDSEFDSAAAAGRIGFSTVELFRDAYGQIVAVRDRGGAVERERFDGQGRSIDRIDSLSTRTVRILDGSGNCTRTYRIEHTGGVPGGQEVFVQDYEYDELNREIARRDPFGNRWTRTYDSLGGLRASTDPLGGIVRQDHNAFGEQVLTVHERADGATPVTQTRTYDARGNLTSLANTLGHRTEYDYDLLDRRVTVRFAAAAGRPAEHYRYDEADNLVGVSQRSGIVRSLVYDLANRHIRTDVDDSGAEGADRLAADSARFRRFEYDAAGFVTLHENDHCRVRITRDSLGRATVETTDITGRDPQRLRRKFDAAGRVTGIVFPSGREVAIDRDPGGRTSLVRTAATPGGYAGDPANAGEFEIARFQYTGSRVVAGDFGNGTRLLLDYDGRGHTVERRLGPASDPSLWRLQILRDAAGNPRAETVQSSRTRRYHYDSLYQLTSCSDGTARPIDPALVAPPAAPVAPADSIGQSLIDSALTSADTVSATYRYDDAGNRVHTSESGRTAFGSVSDELDRLVSVDGTPWNYDSDGRLRSDGAWRYEYDLTGALQTVRAADGAEEAVFLRDALSRIVIARNAAGTRILLYDGDRPLLSELDGKTSEFVPGHDEHRILHIAGDGQDLWAVHDGVGSLRLLTDAAGVAVATPEYLPFGRIHDPTGAPGVPPFGFAGMLAADTLPLVHSRTRTYRPDVGRHLQPDLAGTIDGTNLYQYAHNSPIRWSDPDGTLALVDDALFWSIGRLFGLRSSEAFLSGIARNFVESWSVVLGTFNTFHGARSFDDVMWGVLKLAHKLTLGLPQEIAGIVAGYGAVELQGARTEHWENVQLIKTSTSSAFTLGSKVIGNRDKRAHEQGHFYQNLVLGPLYLPVIGLPSAIHFGIHQLTGQSMATYHDFYTESWAEAWSGIGRAPTSRLLMSWLGLGLGLAAAASGGEDRVTRASRRRGADAERNTAPRPRQQIWAADEFQRPFLDSWHDS
ncbi:MULTISPECIES: RHS repeat-associated core domain-containing protein [Nocardia]|uniref:RHS repeat-associated core domain-containing protein n=1 Tax=Nocardia abscessus TaxID=120957 RepID=UPI001895E281|nr:RHS repeat-associated core domain-containing protein [Nocardia abscessus]MBF6474686.1 hypothetical protein [Nocardia abscessus]